jgi:hypothetical protein
MHSVSTHAQSPVCTMASGWEDLCEVSMKKVALYTRSLVRYKMIATEADLWGGSNIFNLMKREKEFLLHGIDTSANCGDCARCVVDGDLDGLDDRALNRAEGALGSLCLMCVQSGSFERHFGGCNQHG